MATAGEGSGHKGGPGGGVPQERDDPGSPYVIPSLTSSASSSPPIQAPFVTPVNPATGQYLSAAIVDRWVNNNNWLWSVATRNQEVFTGFYVNAAVAMTAETTVWQGWFQYEGVGRLLHSIWGFANCTMKIYIADNTGSEVTVFNSSTAPTANTYIDITSGTSFTVGGVYRVRITLNGGGSNPSAVMDFLAIETANSYSFPTLVALADADTPTAANLATISTGQNFLYGIAAVGAGCSAALQGNNGNGSDTIQFNGGFFMRGRDSTHLQVTLNIGYKFQNGTAVLKTYAIGSTTVIDSFTLTSNGNQHTDSYALTMASYTVDTFYRISVQTSSGGSTAQNVDWITVGGQLVFTTIPVKVAHLDTVKGSGGQLATIGGSGAAANLKEARIALKGAAGLQTSSADYGFQMLAADQSLGKITTNAGIVSGYTIGSNATRIHVFRFLRYITAAGASPQFTYGAGGTAGTQTLTVSTSWTTFDTQQAPALAYGQSYVLSGILAAFETIS